MKRLVVFTGVVLMLLVVPVAMSQEISTGDTSTTFDPTGKLRLQASVFGGGGTENHPAALTTQGDTITISGGGGIGFGLEAGFCVSSSIEISSEFGLQSSSLSKKVENAEGSFTRTFVRPALKVKFPVSDQNLIKLGVGGGYYFGGDLDIDMSQIAGGGHNIYTYKGAAGFHITGEFEHIISSWSSLSAQWSWGVGLRYFSVKYDLESMTSDGISVPLDQLTQDLRDRMMELDGSGFDVFGYLAIYL